MYEVVVTDRSYVPQGTILDMGGFTFNRSLNKLATVAFQVPLESEHEARLGALDGFIKVYRNGVLQFVGPLVTSEETADGEARSIAVTAADAGWILSKRIVGRSVAGTKFDATNPRHNIARAIIDLANTDQETGIDTTVYTGSSGSQVTYKIQYGNVLSAIQELGDSLNGYDWLMRPRENWVSGALSGSKIANFQVATLIGTTQSNAVFEYGRGTRSNVLGYTLTRTRDQQANIVYHLGNDLSNVKTGTNGAALTAWGRMEDVASGDFTDNTFRQELVDEHVAVRGNPRVLIRFTPHIDPGAAGHVPQPFVDYDVGDTISFRAVNAGTVRFAGTVRVYGIRISVDDSGFERVELVVEDE